MGSQPTVSPAFSAVASHTVPNWLDALPTPRERRVLIALAASVMLGFIDLYFTVLHIQSVGLPESNPIARALIAATGSVAALAVFKFLTMAVNVGVLWSIRRTRAGEIGAWVALSILVVLSFWWTHYNAFVFGNAEVLEALREAADCEFTVLLR